MSIINAAPSSIVINNAEPRRDIHGQIVDAHDGCLECFNGIYYLYGTRYGSTDGFGKTNRYVCFSSPDLVAWTPHGEILEDAPPRLYFRPYVKFNPRTGKYVLWYNADSQYGVAVSEKPCGPFRIVNGNVPVTHNAREVGDHGLFVDEDGAGYLLYTSNLSEGFEMENEPIPHHRIYIEKLTPDYLASAGEVGNAVAGNCESPAMFKRGGVYYLLFDNTCCFGTSGTGVRVYTSASPLGSFAYRGNINIAASAARDLPSPWTKPGTGRPDSIIRAQQSHVALLPLAGRTEYLWIGDRWGSRPDGIKGHDFQYWHPLEFEEDGMIKQFRWEPIFRLSAQ